MSWAGGRGGGGGGRSRDGSGLQAFLTRVKEASDAKDGKTVATLLSLRSLPKAIGQQIASRVSKPQYLAAACHHVIVVIIIITIIITTTTTPSPPSHHIPYCTKTMILSPRMVGIRGEVMTASNP